MELDEYVDVVKCVLVADLVCMWIVVGGWVVVYISVAAGWVCIWVGLAGWVCTLLYMSGSGRVYVYAYPPIHPTNTFPNYTPINARPRNRPHAVTVYTHLPNHPHPYNYTLSHIHLLLYTHTHLAYTPTEPHPTIHPQPLIYAPINPRLLIHNHSYKYSPSLIHIHTHPHLFQSFQTQDIIDT